MRNPIAASALATILVVPLALAGCGGSDDETKTTPKVVVPANAVAVVGGKPITKQEYQRILDGSIVHAQQTQVDDNGKRVGGGPLIRLDPPTFRKCVAAYRAGDQRLPKNLQLNLSDRKLKQNCQESYERDRGEAMQLALEAVLLEKAAAKAGVRVTPTEVRGELKRDLNLHEASRIFNDLNSLDPKSRAESDQEYLTARGGKRLALLHAKVDLLKATLLRKAVEASRNVSDQDILRAYNKNAKRFARPARRDVVYMIAKTEAEAQRAKAALEAGGDYPTVAKRLKLQAGPLLDLSPGRTKDPTFEKAVFSAVPGTIAGPIKAEPGWAVFTVTKLKPADRQPLNEVRDTLHAELQKERGQKATARHNSNFVKFARGETTCAKGYVVVLCGSVSPTPPTR